MNKLPVHGGYQRTRIGCQTTTQLIDRRTQRSVTSSTCKRIVQFKMLLAYDSELLHRLNGAGSLSRGDLLRVHRPQLGS